MSEGYIELPNVVVWELGNDIPTVKLNQLAGRNGLYTVANDMKNAKGVTTSGQIKSYYGFEGENVNTQISTYSDIKTAEKLGKATETYIINENGEKVKLEKDAQINVLENSNFSTGNVSGTYKKTDKLLDTYEENIQSDSTKEYSHFRLTIVP